jgi:DNA (cytosine-5)-methyltransferase 1
MSYTQEKEIKTDADAEHRAQFHRAWLQDQEENNLGGDYLMRHGDGCVWMGTASNGLPSGLPIVFADKDFITKVKNSPHLKKQFPKWDFSGNIKQNLGGKKLTPEEVKERLAPILAKLREINAQGGTKKRNVTHTSGNAFLDA